MEVVIAGGVFDVGIFLEFGDELVEVTAFGELEEAGAGTELAELFSGHCGEGLALFEGAGVLFQFEDEVVGSIARGALETGRGRGEGVAFFAGVLSLGRYGQEAAEQEEAEDCLRPYGHKHLRAWLTRKRKGVHPLRLGAVNGLTVRFSYYSTGGRAGNRETDGRDCFMQVVYRK